MDIYNITAKAVNENIFKIAKCLEVDVNELIRME